MELERWLRKNNMETTEFAARIGCTRKTIWKIKAGLKVDSIIAKKVYFVTGGAVSPQVTTNRGRPRKHLSTEPTLGIS